MMSSSPTLMALYSSDAVEVRYSDGSRLEISSCGSTIIFHPAALASEHPRHGISKIVHKRTIFVTSEHKKKVLQALDFRNRFAERPYLGEELLNKDDIVALYAKINRLAWPKCPEEANVEILPDCSRRITSLDEYASLIVSPHGQDFTVCYLSQTSTEMKTSKYSRSSIPSSVLIDSMLQKVPNTSNEFSSLRPREAVVHPFETHPNPLSGHTFSSTSEHAKSGINSYGQYDKDGLSNINQKNTSQQPNGQQLSAAVEKLTLKNSNEHSKSISTNHSKMAERLTCQDLGQIHNNACSIEHHQKDLSCMDSPSAHELSSISRSSTPDGLRMSIDSDITFTQDIIPTSHPQQETATQYTSSPNELNVLHKNGRSNDVDSLNGSFLESCQQQQVKDLSLDEKLDNALFDQHVGNISLSSTLKNNCSYEAQKTVEEATNVNIAQKLDFDLEQPADNMSVSAEADVKTAYTSTGCAVPDNFSMKEPDSHSRINYIWITKHASIYDCPVEWSIPLKLALEGHQKLSSNESIPTPPNLRRLQTFSAKFRADNKNCTFSIVPPPLSLYCPYQHKHKALLNHLHLDDTEHLSHDGDFQRGKLKVVISEGIVYRLIHKGELRLIEVYPGDGSVLVSQGVHAHFYTHFILVGNKLEERIYSLKSLPPRQKGKTDIEKLIKTAHRFFSLNIQWEKRGLKDEIPCWKKEVIAIVEPLSTSLLEECTVEGLGKFFAYSNGRIRIVFTNRAALDMCCNFSSQWKGDQAHKLHTSGAYSLAKANGKTIFGASTARLLLPSGDYITVDVCCPGIYRSYIQFAKDWVSWVTSCPSERYNFCQQHQSLESLQKAAELELKKIFCFNYIVDQTMLKPQPEDLGQCPRFYSPDLHAHTPATGVPAEMAGLLSTHLWEDNSVQWSHHQPMPHNCDSCQTQDHFNQEFHNVRQVLLQNSSLISEIDSFLEKTRKS